MTTKDNNSKNKKSNVIYINRNKNTGKMNTKNNSIKKNTSSSKPVSKSNEENISSNSKKPKTLKKGTKSNNASNKGKVSNQTKKSLKSNKSSNKVRKIKWDRVAIAVVLVVVLAFGGFKGIQMMNSKNSKLPTKNTESISKENTTNNSLSKGQYDLDDENNSHDKKYNIVVDAGHGGKDKGSLDSTDTIYEKDISLQIAKKVAARLGRESDVNVVMTRTEDKYVSLEERAEIAKRANADALISIHLNAQKKFGDANGLETWFRGDATDGSKELAVAVQKTTASYVDITSRGILRNSFEILRETTMPAVLVECGFITNVDDMKKLKDPNFQDMMAEGIMQGTLSFLDEKNGKN